MGQCASLGEQNDRQIVFYTPGLRALAHPYRIIAAGRNLVDPGVPFVTKRYHHHTMILTLTGFGRVQMKDRRYDAGPGTVTWLDTSRHYAHGCHPDHASWRYLWFGMQGHGLDTLFEGPDVSDNPVRAGQGTMPALFESAIANLVRKDRMTDANATQIAARIIALFLESGSADGPMPDQAEPIHCAMQAFLDDLSDPWDVEEFASRSHHSVSHFYRRFKALTGVSPKRWMRQERINAAKYLLSTSNEKIALVGRRCGYPDPYHFSRVFRQLTGVTPRRFRSSGGP